MILWLAPGCAHPAPPPAPGEDGLETELLAIGPLRSAPGHRGTLARVSLPAGYVSAWHHHPGEELVYVVSGRGRLVYADHTVELGPGDATFVPALLPHRDENPGPEPLVVVCTVIAPGMVPLTIPEVAAP